MSKLFEKYEHVITLSAVFIAIVSVFVSVSIAKNQSQLTQEALALSRMEIVYSQAQSRAATCYMAGANYAEQAWSHGMIEPDDFAEYGLPVDTVYYEGGPNQILSEFSGAAIAAGRAIQICVANNSTEADLRVCIQNQVNIDAHRVDDDLPLDGEVDGLVC